MIRINIDQETNRTEIDCNGCLNDIISDLHLAIHNIYNIMADIDEEKGAYFRYMMSTAMTDPDCTVWGRVEGIPAKVKVTKTRLPGEEDDR